MKFKPEGKGYFVTDRVASPLDPPDLVRSTASPGSASHPSPYSSSLRSTHVAAEPDAAVKVEDPMTPTTQGMPLYQANPQLGLSPSAAVYTPSDDFLSNPGTLNFNPTLNGTPGSGAPNAGMYPALGFDGFGFGSEQTPEALFDWDQWSSFFSSVPNALPMRGMSGTHMNGLGGGGY